jgi:hypothetical protein
MKKIYLIIILFNVLSLNSQLKIDAGKDRNFCYTNKKGIEISPKDSLNGLTNILGGNPTAFNGVLPYSYEWTFLYYTIDGKTVTDYAGFYLDSIFSPNPKIIKLPSDSIFFILKVFDKNLTTIRDTVKVKVSNMTLFRDNFIKKMDDTISIYQQYNEPKISDFYWENTSYLSNNYGQNNKAWNKTDVNVKVWAKAENLCLSDTNLIQISIDKNLSLSNFNINNILKYHNYINNSSVFALKNTELIEKIEVINLFGQTLFQIKPEKELYIGQTIENPGMYFINFIYKNNQNQIIKIIRE